MICFKKSYYGLLSDFCNWTVSYCLCISYFSSILLCNNLFIRDHISQNCDKVINSPMLLVIIQMICSVVSSTHWKLCRFVLEPIPMLLVIIQMICFVVVAFWQNYPPLSNPFFSFYFQFHPHRGVFHLTNENSLTVELK